MSEAGPRATVVMVTRDRRAEALATLGRLARLPERPPVVAVDNASADGTAAAVEAAFPAVRVIRAPRNLGGAGRNLGVAAADTPYVAFCDDDSWPEPGAIAHAINVLDACPRLALLHGRVVGPDGRDDPFCAGLERSPLPAEPGMPGPALLGFMACAAVVRRDAFLAAGGFEGRFGVGGEEDLLALDLAAAGWWLCYDRRYVVHHHPSPRRPAAGRRATVVRNALWTAWLRRSLGGAARRTARLAAGWRRDRATARGLLAAAAGLPWVVARRRVMPRPLEAARDLLDRLAPPPAPLAPEREQQ
jgi:GT2 family glycosyltransferase